MGEDEIHVNGIDGVTGRYLVPPFSSAQAAAAVRGPAQVGWLEDWLRLLSNLFSGSFLGLPDRVDPLNITQAGWGVVFARDTDRSIRDALEPLIAHRRHHVLPDRFKVLEYQPGTELRTWLRAHGVDTLNVTPSKVPYYLLLVGDADAIPFDLQYQLDVEYAVGRLAFDRANDYAQYARSVVRYETSRDLASAREVVFWAPSHTGDPATELSARHLVRPLHEGTPAAGGEEANPPVVEGSGFTSRLLVGDQATRAGLYALLHDLTPPGPPAVVFTASHGIGFPKGHADQSRAQGALIGQEWPGVRNPVRPEHYLAANDITDDARVHGLVAFHFACYGAGTPRYDPFPVVRGTPVEVADRPFVAALPRRLLSHPRGGVLAVLGHVDRAWGLSILPRGVGPQITPFRNFLQRVLRGEPVGHATRDFSRKFATLSAQLLEQFDTSRPVRRLDDWDMALAWTERNDAQSYVMLGDPAVRLRVDRSSPAARGK